MEIRLTPEQESFVRHAIDVGRFSTPEQAVAKALDEMAERERVLTELRADVQVGIDQLDRGEYIQLDTEEELKAFFDDIVGHGHMRLAQQTTEKNGV